MKILKLWQNIEQVWAEKKINKKRELQQDYFSNLGRLLCISMRNDDDTEYINLCNSINKDIYDSLLRRESFQYSINQFPEPFYKMIYHVSKEIISTNERYESGHLNNYMFHLLNLLLPYSPKILPSCRTLGVIRYILLHLIEKNYIYFVSEYIATLQDKYVIYYLNDRVPAEENPEVYKICMRLFQVMVFSLCAKLYAKKEDVAIERILSKSKEALSPMLPDSLSTVLFITVWLEDSFISRFGYIGLLFGELSEKYNKENLFKDIENFAAYLCENTSLDNNVNDEYNGIDINNIVSIQHRIYEILRRKHSAATDDSIYQQRLGHVIGGVESLCHNIEQQKKNIIKFAELQEGIFTRIQKSCTDSLTSKIRSLETITGSQTTFREKQSIDIPTFTQNLSKVYFIDSKLLDFGVGDIAQTLASIMPMYLEEAMGKAYDELLNTIAINPVAVTVFEETLKNDLRTFKSPILIAYNNFDIWSIQRTKSLGWDMKDKQWRFMEHPIINLNSQQSQKCALIIIEKTDAPLIAYNDCKNAQIGHDDIIQVEYTCQNMFVELSIKTPITILYKKKVKMKAYMLDNIQ